MVCPRFVCRSPFFERQFQSDPPVGRGSRYWLPVPRPIAGSPLPDSLIDRFRHSSHHIVVRHISLAFTGFAIDNWRVKRLVLFLIAIVPAWTQTIDQFKIVPKTEAKIYFDQAHGEFNPPEQMKAIGTSLHYTLEPNKNAITPESLQGSRLVYLRAPNGTFTQSEKTAIIQFVKNGGSLLLVLDEEQRQSLAKTGVNDIIAPFGMQLTPDTPQIDNVGAIAKAGEINHADREIPYDGGRAVTGGTPFAYQLDKQGKPGQPFAAYATVPNGGRVIVMGEGMASLFLGEPGAERLKVDKDNTKWWGKDSSIYMEEVLAWLVR